MCLRNKALDFMQFRLGLGCHIDLPSAPYKWSCNRLIYNPTERQNELINHLERMYIDKTKYLPYPKHTIRVRKRIYR